MELSSVLFIVSVITLYIFYSIMSRKYQYWKQKGVVGPKPLPFIGNFAQFIIRNESIASLTKKIYHAYPKEKVVGIYQGSVPLLLIRDPDLIKQVLIKDFANFSDRGVKVSNDPLSDNLFSAEGDTWRFLRQNFTPMFTSGKLKNMFNLINKCVEDLQNYTEQVVTRKKPHEIRSLMAKYTLEIIGSCAFGMNMGTLTDDENIFRKMGEKIFEPRLKATIWRVMEMMFPGIIKLFNISITNPLINKFFINLVRDMLVEREGKPKIRKDFMDLLIEMKEQSNSADKVADKEKFDMEITNYIMAAQALVFFAAGFETSSAAMSFLLYELALNQEIQDRVHKEISVINDKYGGEMTYEALKDLTYLEMVLDETLRKYPPGGVLLRECGVDYNFPSLNIQIKKGTKIMIPVNGIHSDSKYFPDPDDFNPERFTSENKIKMHPCTYLPFGEGPRNCIGLRFAKIESMMGLAGLLLKFKVEPSEKTKSKLKFDTRSITLKSADGIWLNISKR